MKVVAQQDDRLLVQTGTRDNGLAIGYVLDPVNGPGPEKALAVYLAHGYWTPVDGEVTI